MINICLFNILCAFSCSKKMCLIRYTTDAQYLINNAKLKFHIRDVHVKNLVCNDVSIP